MRQAAPPLPRLNADKFALGALLATLLVLAAWFAQPDTTAAPPCDKCLTLTAREQLDGNAFLVRASINGISDTYLVDTGASSVTLPGSYLSKLHLNPAKLPRTKTTSVDRTNAAYEITIPRLTVGPCQLRDVEAVIVPDQIEGPLLGMSAINQMGMKIENGKLFLTCSAVRRGQGI